MAATTTFRPAVVTLLLFLSAARLGMAQDSPAPAGASEVELPVIADEPKTVDPAALMPEALTKPGTCDLSESSLSELVDWLRKEQGLVVLLDKQALSDAGLLPSELISDRLADAPVYFLLNRLRPMGLEWYFRDGIVHITTEEEAETRFTTTPHNVGDLLDAGYDQGGLTDLIQSVVAPMTWDSVGGPGTLSSLGDVLFVRQTGRIQREVEGLLTALRKHGRMTFTFDPPQHAALRQKLTEPMSVEFRDTPLETAIETLAEKSGADIRLDLPALRDIRIRPREPITLDLNECKLQTVLQAMLMDLDLTWTLRDGVLWVTSKERAEMSLKTAVYDVRDLCRDEDESDSLLEAVMSQTDPTVWDEVGGPGSIQSAKPGTMVVLNEERILLEVLDLLETYRAALRSSKPRDREAAYEQEVIEVYYRMDAAVADDLAAKLPELVRPDSWKSDSHPDAPGKMIRIASAPEVIVRGEGSSDGSPVFLAEQAVLLITQSRAAHREIAEVIRRVKQGDPPVGTDFGGNGMGGFGGGFFSLPPGQRDDRE